MGLIPTQSDLRSKLENNKCDKAYILLSKCYEQCRNRFCHYQVNKSPNFKCNFNEVEIKWLGELLNAWPDERKENQVSLFLKKYQHFSITSKLSQLGLERQDILCVETSLKILTLTSRYKVSREELEELAIRCGEVSRCQLCEYGHVTSSYVTEELLFRGCIENPKIIEPVFGDCPIFFRRGETDEKNIT